MKVPTIESNVPKSKVILTSPVAAQAALVARDEKPREGLHEGLPIEVYHSDQSSISNSGLGEILRSPAHYIAYRNRPVDAKDFEDFGTAAHAGILEPELFYNKGLFVIQPETILVRRGKAWDEFQAEHAGKTILKPRDFNAIENVIEAVYAHPDASELLRGGTTEGSFFWTDPKLGVRCRARPDKWNGDYTLEIKTTKDAEPSAFNRDLFDYAYPRQGAFAHEGIARVTGRRPTRHLIIAVEKTDPYGITCWEVSKEDLERGRQEAESALQIFSNCQQSDQWPGYHLGILKSKRPAWMK